ncbi:MULTISPECIES: ABC transporter substrate-binding protein [unclassified Afipia]|uniref:ABC transporter substrate-binding protein n=1 Tax=unclassified Afipia TaxID=2642050 RepID=UPI000426ADF5|nr:MULTISPECIES: ABC transporter substrate-binding protein [unclassified Afipia]
MNFKTLTKIALGLIVAYGLATSDPAFAQKRYDPGASDTEIKIGNTSPHSGPASAYSAIAKAQAAYFKMINDGGGINGRTITYISYDDGYSPPKTVEQARKLIESDEVLLLLSNLGTPGNTAIHKYMNQRKVPQLFVTSGADKWADPANYPWTMALLPSYRGEARIYAQYILATYPDAKIGVLYQNDDFGKDYLIGLKEALGEKAGKLIVAEVPFEVSAPTIDSQIVQIKAANPTVFINIGTPKFVAQSIRKVGELNWKVVQIIPQVATTIGGVIKPAGFENAQGVLSAYYLKDATDPKWKSDRGMIEWNAFMDKYLPDADRADSLYVYGYAVTQIMVQVLKQCGDDLTRENVMKQAANLDMDVNMLLPGIRVKTSANDYRPIEQLQMIRFSKDQWELFGPILSSENKPM